MHMSPPKQCHLSGGTRATNERETRMALEPSSNASGLSGNPLDVLYQDPKWRQIVTLAAISSLTDGQVRDAFEILCGIHSRRWDLQRATSPDALKSLQADSQWKKLLDSADLTSSTTRIDTDTAFRMLQDRFHRITITDTPQHEIPSKLSSSSSEHGSVEADSNSISGSSSFAPPNESRPRLITPQPDSTSDEVIQRDGNENEADELYELGTPANAYYNVPT